MKNYIIILFCFYAIFTNAQTEPKCEEDTFPSEIRSTYNLTKINDSINTSSWKKYIPGIYSCKDTIFICSPDKILAVPLDTLNIENRHLKSGVETYKIAGYKDQVFVIIPNLKIIKLKSKSKKKISKRYRNLSVYDFFVNEKNIWIVTYNGIFVKDHFLNDVDGFEKFQLKFKRANSIFIYKNFIFLGTDNGAVKYDTSKKRYKYIPGTKKFTINKIRGNNKGHIYIAGNAGKKNKGRLWFYDAEEDTMTMLLKRKNSLYKYKSDNFLITDLLIDSMNNLWIASKYVYKYDFNRDWTVYKDTIYAKSLAMDNKDRLWVGTGTQGVFMIKDTKTRKLKPKVVSFENKNACSGSGTEFRPHTELRSGTIDKMIWEYGDGKIDSLIRLDGEENDSLIWYRHDKKKIIYYYKEKNISDLIKKEENNDTSLNFRPLEVVGKDIFGKSIFEDEGVIVTHVYETSGIFNVKLTAISNHGCKKDTIIKIKIKPKPEAYFEIENLCDYQDVELTNKSTISSGEFKKMRYKLYVRPKKLSASKDTILYNKNASYSTNSVRKKIFKNKDIEQEYFLQLSVETDSGCRDTLVKSFRRFPQPILQEEIPDNFCENDSAKFSIIPAAADSIHWSCDFGDGNDTVFNKRYVPIDTTIYFKHKYKNLSKNINKFKIVLSAKSKKNCVDTVRKTISVRSMPDASYSYDNKLTDPQTLFRNPPIATYKYCQFKEKKHDSVILFKENKNDTVILFKEKSTIFSIRKKIYEKNDTLFLKKDTTNFFKKGTKRNIVILFKKLDKNDTVLLVKNIKTDKQLLYREWVFEGEKPWWKRKKGYIETLEPEFRWMYPRKTKKNKDNFVEYETKLTVTNEHNCKNENSIIPKIKHQQYKKNNLILIIDGAGSMFPKKKFLHEDFISWYSNKNLRKLKNSLKLWLSCMNKDDFVSIITWKKIGNGEIVNSGKIQALKKRKIIKIVKKHKYSGKLTIRLITDILNNIDTLIEENCNNRIIVIGDKDFISKKILKDASEIKEAKEKLDTLKKKFEPLDIKFIKKTKNKKLRDSLFRAIIKIEKQLVRANIEKECEGGRVHFSIIEIETKKKTGTIVDEDVEKTKEQKKRNRDTKISKIKKETNHKIDSLEKELNENNSKAFNKRIEINIENAQKEEKEKIENREKQYNAEIKDIDRRQDRKNMDPLVIIGNGNDYSAGYKMRKIFSQEFGIPSAWKHKLYLTFYPRSIMHNEIKIGTAGSANKYKNLINSTDTNNIELKSFDWGISLGVSFYEYLGVSFLIEAGFEQNTFNTVIGIESYTDMISIDKDIDEQEYTSLVSGRDITESIKMKTYNIPLSFKLRVGGYVFDRFAIYSYASAGIKFNILKPEVTSSYEGVFTYKGAYSDYGGIDMPLHDIQRYGFVTDTLISGGSNYKIKNKDIEREKFDVKNSLFFTAGFIFKWEFLSLSIGGYYNYSSQEMKIKNDKFNLSPTINEYNTILKDLTIRNTSSYGAQLGISLDIIGFYEFLTL